MFYQRKHFKFQTILIVILGSILAFNLYFIISRTVFRIELPKLFGFAQVLVISGSMQPDLEVGDMLIIQEEASYKVNDIVTYHWGKSLVTHRVVGIIASDKVQYITKGDANNVADEPIDSSEVEGKVVFKLPLIGNIVQFIGTPFGILTTIFSMVLLLEIPSVIERIKRKKL